MVPVVVVVSVSGTLADQYPVVGCVTVPWYIATLFLL